MNKAVFLDRDGVLNRSTLVDGVPKPPISISDIQILDGAIEAIQLLKDSNYVPVVVTNQPDISRGIISLELVQSINQKIGDLAGINHFYVCPHDDRHLCRCRKPKPGLIQLAASELNLELKGSILVGDRWRDIEAGQALNLTSYFIDYSYDEKQPNLPYVKVSSLFNAVQKALGK
jgi:D-glycero-D-manno-heptose 1,7-bisphosphate phosphatase